MSRRPAGLVRTGSAGESRRRKEARRPTLPPRLAGLLAAAAVVASACGPDLIGPTVRVQNATASPLVVGVIGRQWLVPAGSTRFLTDVGGGQFGTPVAVSVFDGATCALLAVASLRFSDQATDQTLVVRPEATPEARPTKNSDGSVQASPAPSLCPSADGSGAIGSGSG